MKIGLISAAIGIGAIAAPASAATVILNNGTPYAEVVHANSAGAGNTLNTLTMPGSIAVSLFSADGIDVGAGNGVAIVKGLGNGQGNGFSSLLIDPSVGFSVMQFKIEDFANQRGRDFDIKVNFVGGGSQTINNFLLPANSKIDVLAAPGEILDSIQVYGLMNASGQARKFMDIKQISFDPVIKGAVPEPAAWAMMLAGFGLVGSAMRRRQPAKALAAA